MHKEETFTYHSTQPHFEIYREPWQKDLFLQIKEKERQ